MLKLFGGADAAHSGTTLISDRTVVEGTIRFAGVLEIEGQVSGDIAAIDDAEAVLRVMRSGRVFGNINVPLIVINGVVTGTVYSTSHVELAANAVVVGDVFYNLIEMTCGAQVNGNLVFNKDLKLPAAIDGGGAMPCSNGKGERLENC